MLMRISREQLLSIWADLVEAYHGVNSFGSDTAEIYAYRFGRESNYQDLMNEIHYKNYDDLVSLLGLFCKDYDCSCEVDGEKLDSWAGEDLRFLHRCQVKIIKKNKSEESE